MRSALKMVRGFQPLNSVATSVARLIFGARNEWVIKHLPRTGNVETRLPNGGDLRLWSKGDDWISNQVYWRGWDGVEPETVTLWWTLSTQATVILDIGAHVGLFSLLAAHANPKAQVHAFEPLPAALERLRRHVALNDLANIKIHPAAVARAPGRAYLYAEPGTIPSGCQLNVGEGERAEVEVVAIDGMFPRVDLVKMDTETTEPDVLRGMCETLARDRPAIICEVLTRGRPQEIESLLFPLGYLAYELTKAGPVRRDHVEPGPDGNYLFLTEVTRARARRASGEVG